MQSRIDHLTNLRAATGAVSFLANDSGSHFGIIVERLVDKSDARNWLREKYSFSCVPNQAELENKHFAEGSATHAVCLEETSGDLFLIELDAEGQQKKRSLLPPSESHDQLKGLCRSNSPDSAEAYKLIRAAQGLTEYTYQIFQWMVPHKLDSEMGDLISEEIAVPEVINADSMKAFDASDLGDYSAQTFSIAAEKIRSNLSSLHEQRGRAVRPYANYLLETYQIQITPPPVFTGTLEEWLDANARSYGKPTVPAFDSNLALSIATGLAGGLTGVGLLVVLCAVTACFAITPVGLACLVGATLVTGALAAVGLYKIHKLHSNEIPPSESVLAVGNY